MTKASIRIKPLGTVAKVISGFAFKSAEFCESGIPVIKIKNIQLGEVDFTEMQCVPEQYLSIDSKYHVHQGDILISLTGSHINQPNSVVGRVARYKKGVPKALLNQRAGKVLIWKPEACDADFLFYQLFDENVRRDIAAFAHGAANQANVSPGQIESLYIHLPPLPTQRKIAAILSAYDDLIENNLRRIKILEEMAQNLYREWFVKFRFPGHQHARFTDSPLGSIPEGWEVVSLEKVCSRITDGSHHSPKTTNFGYPMASVKDMHDWGININTCRTISEEEFHNLVRNDCKMRKGDVLIAKDGSYLKHCFVVERDLDVALLSSIAILRPNEKINSHVLAMTLREPNMKTRMTGFVSGAALPRIILQAFRQFQIVLPHIALQERWAASAESMIQLCWRLLNANANLRRTRDLLLPRLISGEVDVSKLAITVSREAIA